MSPTTPTTSPAVSVTALSTSETRLFNPPIIKPTPGIFSAPGNIAISTPFKASTTSSSNSTTTS